MIHGGSSDSQQPPACSARHPRLAPGPRVDGARLAVPDGAFTTAVLARTRRSITTIDTIRVVHLAGGQTGLRRSGRWREPERRTHGRSNLTIRMERGGRGRVQSAGASPRAATRAREFLHEHELLGARENFSLGAKAFRVARWPPDGQRDAFKGFQRGSPTATQ